MCFISFSLGHAFGPMYRAGNNSSIKYLPGRSGFFHTATKAIDPNTVVRVDLSPFVFVVSDTMCLR